MGYTFIMDCPSKPFQTDLTKDTVPYAIGGSLKNQALAQSATSKG
jgi:hypothetical protein